MTQPARATDTTLPKASVQSRQWNLSKARRPGPESDTSRWSFHFAVHTIDANQTQCPSAQRRRRSRPGNRGRRTHHRQYIPRQVMNLQQLLCGPPKHRLIFRGKQQAPQRGQLRLRRGPTTSSTLEVKDVRRWLTDHSGRWRPISADGIEFSTPRRYLFTRYRYRGKRIPNPWAHAA
jgi:hypothetical protein